jgi:hypothetical protein
MRSTPPIASRSKERHARTLPRVRARRASLFAGPDGPSRTRFTSARRRRGLLRYDWPATISPVHAASLARIARTELPRLRGAREPAVPDQVRVRIRAKLAREGRDGAAHRGDACALWPTAVHASTRSPTKRGPGGASRRARCASSSRVRRGPWRPRPATRTRGPSTSRGCSPRRRSRGPPRDGDATVRVYPHPRRQRRAAGHEVVR